MTTALHTALAQAREADVVRHSRRAPLLAAFRSRRAKRGGRGRHGSAPGDRETLPPTWRPGSAAQH